ncbi:glucosamine--fructose-6-phosphate aminotransferase [Poriferisphaera corsica]|uniref:Glutamine--fructose-6-phosphate aminotransferase [isomerizing] n=1 Tax=Poriferisphaera corsica TaxID=2528020 RepID=A0A517YPX5_9BACT|nr:sugar isomerase [Poriferisphaera corsica]QDU32277.1 glucosamine--fructose-6-phosphate aminotransferase [Poriferisphaera corsica]
MKLSEEKYAKFALCKEMLETVEVIKNFKVDGIEEVVEDLKKTGKLFLTGEGSSRIFPAKNAMTNAFRHGLDLDIATEGGCQAYEYDLAKKTVFGASNSGATKELIALFTKLKGEGKENLFSMTANTDTKVESLSKKCFVLNCGGEDAVAATKSVAEQALLYQSMLVKLAGEETPAEALAELAAKIETVLTMDIDPEITKKIANAGTIYFAGRNDGVAEELTLKTNEITRKKSDYLEGTYAVHGIEEVMNADDVVILVDPFETELEKIKQTLAEGVGLTVVAISSKETIFPTITIPEAGCLSGYVNLAAGWNILVEVGIALGIDLDKPTRARKVGNAFEG